MSAKTRVGASPIAGIAVKEDGMLKKVAEAAAAVGAFFAGHALTRTHPTKDERCAGTDFRPYKGVTGERHEVLYGSEAAMEAALAASAAARKELAANIMRPIKENAEKEIEEFVLRQQSAQAIVDSLAATEDEVAAAKAVVLEVEGVIIAIQRNVMCVEHLVLTDLRLRTVKSEPERARVEKDLGERAHELKTAEAALERAKHDLQLQQAALQKLLSARVPVAAVENPPVVEATATTPTTPQTPSHMNTDSLPETTGGVFAAVKAFCSAVSDKLHRGWVWFINFLTPNFVFSENLTTRLNPTQTRKK